VEEGGQRLGGLPNKLSYIQNNSTAEDVRREQQEQTSPVGLGISLNTVANTLAQSTRLQ
jgi:hypothetical protein